MGIVSTKAVVFSALKYGDTSLIVKCFTFEDGLRSYMIRGVLKSKKGKLKKAYFQPLTLLQIEANHNDKKSLNSLRDAQIATPYYSIHTSISKQTIVMFLAEVLAGIIREEERNPSLYTYLETAFVWLDTHDDIANFHLLFLVNLSRFLGFYPDVSDMHYDAFSLVEGRFIPSPYEKLTLTGSQLVLFKRLLGINFDAIHTISLNKKERQSILRSIIQYFELHLDGFKAPKSLDILETVFS
ncbi:DNA repair protein RecO [Tenacibaculum litopenaei]|jgi:DNA repair protein RecO (recombination protein O)|uniref:DNA repair protein RecO n=1 Tax=Tenacibaculum litopenaei TaxID=396016 RepID=UPI0038930E12